MSSNTTTDTLEEARRVEPLARIRADRVTPAELRAVLRAHEAYHAPNGHTPEKIIARAAPGWPRQVRLMKLVTEVDPEHAPIYREEAVKNESPQRQIKIDKNIPIPPIRRTPETRFPVEHMAKGDSFFVKPDEGQKQYVAAQRVASAVRAWSRRWRDGRWKFTVRQIDGGVRVWRTD